MEEEKPVKARKPRTKKSKITEPTVTEPDLNLMAAIVAQGLCSSRAQHSIESIRKQAAEIAAAAHEIVTEILKRRST